MRSYVGVEEEAVLSAYKCVCVCVCFVLCVDIVDMCVLHVRAVRNMKMKNSSATRT